MAGPAVACHQQIIEIPGKNLILISDRGYESVTDNGPMESSNALIPPIKSIAKSVIVLLARSYSAL